MAVKNERIQNGMSAGYTSMRLGIRRPAGAATAIMDIYGRTSKESRQEAANHTAAITETATLTKINDRQYRVDYTTTHRIIPVEVLAAAGIE